MRKTRPITALAAIAGTLAVAALTLALTASPTFANRCTGTCGDNSTFDKPAATCDACRVLVCPRTCRLDGVTSCLWCGNPAEERSQNSTVNVTVRRGPSPNNPGAPTSPFQGSGSTRLRSGMGMPGPGGTVVIPIEMIQLDLQGVSPMFGPGSIQKQPAPPAPRSGGTFRNLIPEQDFPAESFFDIFVEVDLPAIGGALHNITPIQCYNLSEPTHPIAQENVPLAPVMWQIMNAPIPLHDAGGVIQAWILDGWMEIDFASGDATGVPLLPEPAATEATSWGSVKTLYR